jgi:hypothetical protein
MKPSEIARLIRASYDVDDLVQGPIPSFLISWTAWEAMRTRFLRVLIKRLGWTIRDADKALRELKLSSTNQVERAMGRLKQPAPPSWRGLAGATWRDLAEVERVRHRLAHGFSGLEPRLIRSATRLVRASIEAPSWLEHAPTVSTSGETLGPLDLFGRQSRSPHCAMKSSEELYQLLGVIPTESQRRFPREQALRVAAARLTGDHRL